MALTPIKKEEITEEISKDALEVSEKKEETVEKPKVRRKKKES